MGVGRAELQPVEGAEGKRRGSGQKGKLSGRRQRMWVVAPDPALILLAGNPPSELP